MVKVQRLFRRLQNSSSALRDPAAAAAAASTEALDQSGPSRPQSAHHNPQPGAQPPPARARARQGDAEGPGEPPQGTVLEEELRASRNGPECLARLRAALGGPEGAVLRRLKQLDLTLVPLSAADVAELCLLLVALGSDALQEVSLAQCRLDDAALFELKNLPPSVRKLNLARNRLGDSGHLNVSLPHVVELVISGNRLGQVSRWSLEAPALERINISYSELNGSTAAGQANVAALCRAIAEVKEVNLSGNHQLGPAGLAALSLPKCESLKLANVDLTAAAAAGLGARFPTVKRVDLSNNQVGAGAAELGLAHATHLDLSQNGLPDGSLRGAGFAGVEILKVSVNALKLGLNDLHAPRLLELWAEANCIEDLSQMHGPNVRTLRLAQNCLSSAATRAPALQTATEVDLSANALGSGGGSFAAAESLTLSRNAQLGDAGAHNLRAPHARAVALADTGLKEVSLERLRENENLPLCQSFDLTDNRLSPKARKKIVKLATAHGLNVSLGTL